jgi:hypothetical protein
MKKTLWFISMAVFFWRYILIFLLIFYLFKSLPCLWLWKLNLALMIFSRLLAAIDGFLSIRKYNQDDLDAVEYIGIGMIKHSLR